MPFLSGKRISLFIVIFGLTACDKSSDLEPLPCLLTQQVTSGGVTYGFEYAGEIVVSSSTVTPTGSEVRTFVYDANGNISEVTYPANVRETLTYTNGEITSRKRYNSTNQLVSQTDFEYTGSKLTKIQRYSNSGGGLQKSEYVTLEYSDNSFDPIRRIQFYGVLDTTPASIGEFTYGDKKAAFSAAPEALVKYLRLGGLPVEKNVVKIVYSTGTAINYTYEFNERGYPTKRTETYSSGQVNVQTNSYLCK